MTLETPKPIESAISPLMRPREYGSPPFIKALGKSDSVRTPLGHYRTESLFLEVWRPIEGQRPVYTLERADREDPKVPGNILPSFQAEYVRLQDPSGYKAALSMLGSWSHWQRLAKTAWFKEHLDEWNEEIVAGLRARGLETFVKQADKGDLKAAEWLTNYTVTGPADKPKRGRPTKADINRAAREAAESRNNLKEDAARLGLGAT